ncbi:hypothetical protein [Deinococcus aluminii]|uniref:Uncharacterized protein n=1 Tax=Deinococcus aluminii TaxID=1656885 RepID=A0ABP9XEN6_9DEIO
MTRAAVPFQFTVSAPPGKVRETRVAFSDLTTRLLAVLPEAATVVVSARLGVTVLNGAGESLDLEAVPWAWVEEAVTLLGTGAFTLPREGVRGSDVQEPWIERGKSAGTS